MKLRVADLAERARQAIAQAAGTTQEHPETRDLQGSLLRFVQAGWHVLEPGNPYVHGWHLGCIVEHLEAMTRGEIRKLLLNLPPRHAKSILACVFWCCWEWTINPMVRWLYTAYDQGLATRDSVKSRDLILSPWYQERFGHIFRLKGDQNVKTWFANNRQGYRMSGSCSGRVLGHGADRIVVDDPHNLKDVGSKAKAKVQGVVQWWTRGMISRANNVQNATFLVVQQRLDEDDLTGYLKRQDQGYETLILPAEYEPRRYFFPDRMTEEEKPREAIIPTRLQRSRPELMDPRTEEGQPLWPERFGPRELAEWKQSMQGGWAGMGQQRPAPEEGIVYRAELFRYFSVRMTRMGPVVMLGTGPEAPLVRLEALAFFQCIDTAETKGQTSAYTAIGTFALTPMGDLLIWHMVRVRLLVMEIFPFLMECRQGPCLPLTRPDDGITVADRHGEWPGRLLFQAIEPKSSGRTVLQQARARGLAFKELKVDGDKVRRAASVATLYGQGKVYHRQDATWLQSLEDELKTFPHGSYKDQADVVAYAGALADEDALLKHVGQVDNVFAYPGYEDIAERDSDVVIVQRGRERIEVSFDD